MSVPPPRGSSSSSGPSQSTSAPIPRFVSPISAMRNNTAVNFVRGIFSTLTAIAIGVLGVTGAVGFLIYLTAHLVASAALLFGSMGGKPDVYFSNQGRLGFILSGLGDNLVLFIFVWTAAYALVHVY